MPLRLRKHGAKIQRGVSALGRLSVYDDAGRRFYANPRAFGSFGDTGTKIIVASQPSGAFSIQFTQVSGTPDNTTGAGVAAPGGTSGDPGQTFTDFTKGVSGLGTAPNFPGVPSATISALQTYLNSAEADESAGDTGTPLMVAASNVVAKLNATAAQCVLYQQYDQPLGRSNQRGDIYSNWLETLLTQMTQAEATLAQAAATESAQITGEQATQTVGTATYVSPGTTIGANIAPAPGSLATVASNAAANTVFGLPLVPVLIGGVVIAVAGFLFLKKPKPRPAPAPVASA